MGNCLTPFALKNKTAPNGSTITVPCGRCPNCRRRRIAGWTFRLLQEDRHCITAVFLTLTYDTDHVPITKNKFLTLDKHHVQLYIKKLRKAQEKCPKKIIYYACGEYGGKRKRPHYHMIIFNVLNDSNYQKYWEHGSIYVDQVSGASIAYSLKYMDKPSIIPQFKNDDRQKEFSLMSKGIGFGYLNEKNIQWHTRHILERVYVSLNDYKVSMPRYYKDRIYALFEDKIPLPEGGYHSTNPIRQAVGYISSNKSEERRQATIQAQLVSRTMDQIIHEQVEAHKAQFKQFFNNASKDSF